GADEHLLELRHGAEELLQLLGRAEAHDALDPGAVVPGTVEEHHFAGGGEVRHITLEIPLATLALSRRRERHDAADARIEPLGDALDRPSLAGRIAAFEQHRDLELVVLHPILQPHQLVLQAKELAEIDLAVEPRTLALEAFVPEHLLELLV